MRNVPPEEIYLGHLFKVFKKRKLTIAGFILAFGIGGAFYVYSLPPVYQADSTILIGTKTTDSIKVDGKRFEVVDSTKSNYYKTVYTMLQSKSLLKSLSQVMNLPEQDEFKKDPPFIDPEKIKKWIDSIFSVFGMKKSKASPNTLNSDPNFRLIEELLKRMEITPLPKSHVVHISVWGYDPVVITEINNKYLEMLIQANIARRIKALAGAKKWMSEELLKLNEKITTAKKKLKQFKTRNNIIAFKKNREVFIENLSGYQKEIRKVVTTKLSLKNSKELLLRLKQDPITLLHTLPDNLKTTRINELIAKYTSARKEYEALVGRYSSFHPQTQIAYKKITRIEDTIPKEINSLINSINIDYKAAVLNEKSLLTAEKNEKNKIIQLDEQASTLHSLTQDLQANKTLYDALSLRLKKTAISTYNDESSIQILDNAEVSFIPIRPKKGLIIALCLFMGVTGGIFWVAFAEKTKKSIISVEDVVRQLPFPFLGATGIIRKEDLPLPVVYNANNFIAEEFRTVKTNLMLNGFVEPNKVLMVSSSASNEGKTTVLANLAATFAQDNKRVLIIDGDFVRPKIAETFKVKNQPGLIDIMENPRLFRRIIENHILDSCEIDDIFVKTAVDNVYILPRGTLRRDSKYALNYEIFKKLIGLVKKTFDVILLDTPPALVFSYVSIVAKLCDGVLFVIGSGIKDQHLIMRTLDKLSLASSDLSFKAKSNGNGNKNGSKLGIQRSNIFGLVLNKAQYHRDEYYKYHKTYFREYSNHLFANSSNVAKTRN